MYVGVLCTISLCTCNALKTYVLQPQPSSVTKVTTDLRLPNNLYNYTMCVRVKPRFTLYRQNTCQQIAFAFHHRNGEELFRVSTVTDPRQAPGKTFLNLEVGGCREDSARGSVRHRTSQLGCDGIWRMVCVSAMENRFLRLISERRDIISRSETMTSPCSHTPVMASGGSFVFNSIGVGNAVRVVSDSTIKDIILWKEFLAEKYIRNLATGDPALFPRQSSVAWIFNSHSTFTQIGPMQVKEYEYGKGLFAGPSFLLLGKDERAILTCAVFLNDIFNHTRYQVTWIPDSKDPRSQTDLFNKNKLSPENDTLHIPIQRHEAGTPEHVLTYTLQVNTSLDYLSGNYRCYRPRIRYVEREYYSNAVHITVVEQACKAFTKKDEKYGFLEFSAAVPSNYSIAQCHGGYAKLFCGVDTQWDMTTLSYNCNSILHNSLLDIINGTAPRLSDMSHITPESFGKMTARDFDIIPSALLNLRNYVVNEEELKGIIKKMEDFVDLPVYLPARIRQRYPPALEALSYSLSLVVADQTLYFDHFTVLMKSNVDAGSDLEVGDNTHPKVRVSFAGTSSKVLLIYYRDMSWFRSAEEHHHDLLLNAAVVGAHVPNVSALPVTLTFAKSYVSSNKSRCVYWDIREVGWSSEGCLTKEYSDTVVCMCKHLSSFTVVLEPFTMHYLNTASSISTRISITITFFLILVSLVVWTSMKELRIQNLIKIRINFGVSLCLYFLAYIMTGLFDVQTTVCYVACFLAHWMALACFMWLCSEVRWTQLRILNALSKFGVEHITFIRNSCFLSWGGTLIVPGIAVATATGLSDHRDYIRYDICWVAPSFQTYFILIPIYIMLCYIIYTFCKCAGVVFTFDRLNTSHTHESDLKLQLKGVLSVTLAMGCTWVFAPLLLIKDPTLMPVFQAFYTAIHALQGVVIIVFYVALQPEVRSMCGCTREEEVNAIALTDHNDGCPKFESGKEVTAFQRMAMLSEDEDELYEENVEELGESDDGVFSEDERDEEFGRLENGFREDNMCSSLSDQFFQASSLPETYDCI